MRITKLELAVLDSIALNLYQPFNGGRPRSFADTSDIWSADITFSTCSELGKTVKPRSLPGVCSSLAKKGLVVSQQGSHATQDPGTIRLTEEGFNMWLANFPT